MSGPIVQLLISVLVCQGAGVAGSFFTRSSVAEWYAYLNRPAFTPPDWVFAPVWGMLYTLMGIAVFLVWRRGIAAPGVKGALGIFILQLALNAAWSAVFFGGRSIAAGLTVIVLLWLALAWTIRRFSVVSRPAALLLVPYIVWVSFALVLNASLAALN